MDVKGPIEDFLPIAAISKEASRENSVRKGDISTLPLWWERRPLVACRAAVYGALVQPSRFAFMTNEWDKAQRLADTYWLYMVWDPLKDSPEIVRIHNRVARLDHT